MDEVTQVLERIESGDPQAASELLPLVYQALRNLASRKLAREAPGQTLQATALVHEAYLRRMDGIRPRQWFNRAHFFAAAGEAMRRILVEQARRRQRLKRGGDRERDRLDELGIASPAPDDEILAVHEALDKLMDADPVAAQLVKLRFFSGFTAKEAADALGIPARSADRIWVYARAFLFNELRASDSECRSVGEASHE